LIVEVEKRGSVGLCFLNRPEVLNALNMPLMSDLVQALTDLDRSPDVRAIVLSGRGRAFAAGADIQEMAVADPEEMLSRDHLEKWEAIRRLKKPVIAAVHGFCLGGGLELAMSTDLIVASEDARFGQPEIKIGVMPGAGGTQLLTRLVGAQKAMEMVLTGRLVEAKEAEDMGLVARLVPPGCAVEAATSLAEEISAMPAVAVRLAKESVRRVATEGLDFAFERKNFFLLFATEDQREGMRAFLEKRPPRFRGVS